MAELVMIDDGEVLFVLLVLLFEETVEEAAGVTSNSGCSNSSVSANASPSSSGIVSLTVVMPLVRVVVGLEANSSACSVTPDSKLLAFEAESSDGAWCSELAVREETGRPEERPDEVRADGDRAAGDEPEAVREAASLPNTEPTLGPDGAVVPVARELPPVRDEPPVRAEGVDPPVRVDLPLRVRDPEGAGREEAADEVREAEGLAAGVAGAS